MIRRFLFIPGAIFGLTGVLLGAVGSHMLKSRISEAAIQTFEVGVRYQMAHALLLLILGVILKDARPEVQRLIGMVFCAGIVVFSGSLYLYSLTGETFWAAITPLGGFGLILGWLVLVIYFVRSESAA